MVKGMDITVLILEYHDEIVYTIKSLYIGRNPYQEKSLRKRVSLPAAAHYFKIRLKNRKKYMKYKSACLHLHKPAVF